MDEENKTAINPSEGAAGSMTESGEVPADQPSGDSASTPGPTTKEFENAGTNLGPHQEEAGMRS